MAFAAARMIKEKKEQESRKRSQDNLAVGAPGKGKLSRSPSIASSKTALSQLSQSGKGKNRAKPGQNGKHPGRSAVKCVKKTKKGNKGGPYTYELIVTLDQECLALNDEQVAEYKEVFMLFDKDEDGVLSFQELNVVMKSLGQRPSESKLLSMVRSVSEDTLYDTIEFNEFLQMMSKQQTESVSMESLIDAFRIFDKDEDGKLSVPELKKVVSTLGDRITGRELEELLSEADSRKEGYVHYAEFCGKLCAEKRKKTKSSKEKKNPSVTSKERSPSISSSKGRSSRASSTSKLNKTTTPNGDKINYIVTSEIKT